MEGFLYDAGKFLDVVHKVIVLGDRARDAGHVGFLESVVADDGGAYLAADDHQRNGVHIGCRYAGDGVGGARSAGDHHDAYSAGRPGVAVGHVHGALLVPR